MSKWQPIHDAHSIVSVAVVVNFPDALNDTMLRRVLRFADVAAAKANLAERQPIHEVEFSLIPIAGQLPGGPKTSGLQFRRLELKANANGPPSVTVADQLVVQRDALTYLTTEYDSWTNVRQRMITTLTPVFDAVTSATTIESIRLEFRDRFFWEGDASGAIVEQLLQKTSELVAPHVFRHASPWHSHTGMFVPEASAYPNHD